jgi:anti-sigma regulatory factor (Ser/Thr protein kinase)
MSETVVIGAITLPGLGRSVAHARSFARNALGGGYPSLEDVQTCVSEAFTNGVVHTASGRGGKITVMFVAVDDMVIAEVTDDGAGGALPCLRDDPMGVSGRGVRIINALAVDWGVRSEGGRTIVWMRFPGPIPAIP